MNITFTNSGSRQGVIEAIQRAKPAEAKADPALLEPFKALAVGMVQALDPKFTGCQVNFTVSLEPKLLTNNITVRGLTGFVVSEAEKAAHAPAAAPAQVAAPAATQETVQ